MVSSGSFTFQRWLLPLMGYFGEIVVFPLGPSNCCPLDACSSSPARPNRLLLQPLAFICFAPSLRMCLCSSILGQDLQQLQRLPHWGPHSVRRESPLALVWVQYAVQCYLFIRSPQTLSQPLACRPFHELHKKRVRPNSLQVFLLKCPLPPTR